MKIGMIGVGRMGRALSWRLARAGHSIVMTNAHDSMGLIDAVGRVGYRARAATIPETVAEADTVFLAVPYSAVDDVVRIVDEAGGTWDGKVVVDVTNYYAARDGGQRDPGRESSSVLVARRLPGAKVVKAFNTIWYRRLETEASRSRDGLVVFFAGDDPAANDLVARLIRDSGFDPVYSGSLAQGGKRQEPGSDIYDVPLRRAEAEQRLRLAG